MKGLKWFAGGKERQEQAVAIIDEVIETIGDKPDYADLKQVLHSYRTELADSRSATPYILSRMSLEISKVVRKEPFCSIFLFSMDNSTLKPRNPP